LRPRVYRCFETGGLATGATVAITGGDKPYAEMNHNEDIAALYRKNSEDLGRPFPNLGEWETRPTGSTDMGNVSRAMPSIHPMIGINSLPAVNHQPEFTAHCITPDADKALVDGALAMAWTCIELATNSAVRDRLIARH
jgi:metal-dependent amidase/aminoacylase/carboxypeptidase family protein